MVIRTDEYVARIIVIVALLYVPYYLTASSFFHEERKTQIKCPITVAATVSSKVDGETDVITRRAVVVNCEYAAAKVPEPKFYYGITRDSVYYENGRPRHFSEIANKRKDITEGDAFACTAVWTAYQRLPLARVWPGNNTVLTNCRVMTRS